MFWKRASAQPTTTTTPEPVPERPLSPQAIRDIVNQNDNDELTSQQSKPGVFERTMGMEEQKTRKMLAEALMMVVDNSEQMVEETPQGMSFQTSSLASASSHSWLSKHFGPRLLHKLFAADSLGNYVINRRTGKKEWESMPIYARIGMHLLFYGPAAVRFVTWSWIERTLKEASEREGRIYDSTDVKSVQSHIRSFIATYSIDTSELLEKDFTKYATCFTDF
ncbi:hypothetical protein M422DRAFT_262891 [Sphaerobolus stellatus SS14]|uniref:Uncharacterized protein n=1 Tax=Sphaerobolus stellatus (strain SS14) TaxID=990650 RepID=A0A0C9VBS2_SPHS4|nr:hypothetical protein M422DRAFT_262891 [Sphaerobolus stellatus SS14]